MVEFQKTISGLVEISGVGIHSGQVVNMRLLPAVIDSGIKFKKNDDVLIEALYSNVTSTAMNTGLSSACGQAIGTVEHLMAALYACGITNILIEINGDEVPVMDGSAIEFCRFLEGKIQVQDAHKKSIKILKKISVEEDGASAEIEPFDGFVINMEIDFPHPLIGKQVFSFKEEERNFIQEIAPARTFGFLRDLEYLQSKGLAKGGSLDNAIVLDDSNIINKENLRFHDEFVRHKILDAAGDLFLAGYSIIGKFNGEKSGHKLNNLLLRKLLSDRSAYQI